MFEYEDGEIVYQTSTNISGANSDWAGVAAGDFDNDGIDEFVGVRNFDGHFYLFEYENGEIVYITSSDISGANSDWAGVAAGDFDDDGIDEFVGVRNLDGHFYLFEYEKRRNCLYNEFGYFRGKFRLGRSCCW